MQSDDGNGAASPMRVDGATTLRSDYRGVDIEVIDLDAAQVDIPLVFEDCRFLGTVRFQKAVFNEELTFVGCRFTSVVDFEDAILEGDVRFERCTFDDAVFFRGANFPNRVQFAGCTFSALLTLAGGRTDDASAKVGTVCINHLKFEDCHFFGYTTFNNRYFTRSATFRRCEFHEPPHFQRADMHQGTAFEACTFRVPAGEDTMLAKSERAFRRLRVFAGKIGDTERRNEFVALEFETRRRRRDLSLSERSVIWAYRLGSDFGRSLLRPFATILVSALSLTLVLVVVTDGARLSVSRSALGWFLFQHTVSPFSVAAPDFRPAVDISAAFRELPWLFRLVGVTQSMVTVAAVALFIFAVRRRFVE